jgi:predicted transcriptional regulator
MGSNIHTIEVDESTAKTLQARAAEKGLSVAQLIAELAKVESEPVALDADTISELDRRWNRAEAAGQPISNEEVVRWLKTWGTPGFKSWHDR